MSTTIDKFNKADGRRPIQNKVSQITTARPVPTIAAAITKMLW